MNRDGELQETRGDRRQSFGSDILSSFQNEWELDRYEGKPQDRKWLRSSLNILSFSVSICEMGGGLLSMGTVGEVPNLTIGSATGWGLFCPPYTGWNRA